MTQLPISIQTGMVAFVIVGTAVIFISWLAMRAADAIDQYEKEKQCKYPQHKKHGQNPM